MKFAKLLAAAIIVAIIAYAVLVAAPKSPELTMTMVVLGFVAALACGRWMRI